MATGMFASGCGGIRRSDSGAAAWRRISGCRGFVLAGVLLVLGSGCLRPSAPPVAGDVHVDPTRARLELREIQPAVSLPPAVEITGDAHQEIRPAARRHLRAGKERFAEDLWGEAINELAHALQLAPQLTEARILLARASLLQGNFALAKTHLEEAMRRSPHDGTVYALLCDVAFQERDMSGAIANGRLALLCPNAGAGDSSTILAHLYSGLALRSEGYLTAAVDELNHFLESISIAPATLQPSPELRQAITLYRSRAILEVGDALTALGRRNEAAETYHRGLALSPSDRDLRFRWIRSLVPAGRAEEAIRQAREACLDSGGLDAVDLFAEVCSAVGGTRRTVAELARLGTEARHPALLLQLSRRLESLGRPDEAARLLQRGVELQPENTDARSHLADAYLRLGKRRECVEQLLTIARRKGDADEPVRRMLARAADPPAERKALVETLRKKRGESQDGVAPYFLACLLAMDGATDAAVAALDEAVAAKPPLPAALLMRARIRLSRSQWNEAIRSCEAAAAAGVASGELLRIKAAALDANDDLLGAQKAYEEAIRLAPKDAEAYLALARLKDRLGQTKEAMELLMRVVQDVDVRNCEAQEALVRAFLSTQQFHAAQDRFRALRRSEPPPPVLARVEALMKLAIDPTMSGAARLDRYRATLRQILSKYPEETESGMDLALSFVATREYDSALSALEPLVARMAGNARVLELKMSLLARLLRFDEARAVLARLLQVQPRRSEWLAQAAELAGDAGDFAAAAEAYRKLLARPDLTAQHARFQAGLIESLEHEGDWAAAVEAAKAWLDASPKNPDRRLPYLAALERAGRSTEALRVARKWYADEPERVSTRRLFITELQRAKRSVEAQQTILAWLAKEPENEEVMRMLILSLINTHQADQAIELIDAGTSDANARGWMDRVRIVAHEQAGRFDQAIDELRRLIRSSQDSSLLDDLIRLLVVGRQYTDAESLLQRQIAPYEARAGANVPFHAQELADLYRQLATVYQFSGRPTRCLETLEKLLEIMPSDSGVYNDLGYMLADSGEQLDRAETLIRIAVGERPRNPAFLDSLGWVLYRRGRVAESLPWLKRAVQLSESPDAVICQHLGDALYRSGDLAGAQERWRQSLQQATSKDRTPSPEDEQIAQRCRVRLKAAEQGKPVEVTAFVPPSVQATTVPARKKP